ncbi:MAG TPA: hypothetical protein VNU73_10195, partial [Steroidobacteraceae bacterium]|nr:hypothetical protein [Steroidobacteraceae bacterium]
MKSVAPHLKCGASEPGNQTLIALGGIARVQIKCPQHRRRGEGKTLPPARREAIAAKLLRARERLEAQGIAPRVMLNEFESSVYIGMSVAYLRSARSRGTVGNRTPGPIVHKLGSRVARYDR